MLPERAAGSEFPLQLERRAVHRRGETCAAACTPPAHETRGCSDFRVARVLHTWRHMKRRSLTVLLLLSAAAHAGTRPLVLEAKPHDAPPAGYLLETRPRVGMMLAGTGMFITGWVVSFAAGMNISCHFEAPRCAGPTQVGLIPVAGGIMMANQHYLSLFGGVFSTTMQGAGLILGMIGLFSPERVWVLEPTQQVKLRLTPTGVAGTF